MISGNKNTQGPGRISHLFYNSKNILISDHQTILLKLLDSKIHAYKGSFPDFIGHKELEFLIEQFEIIAKETIVIVLAVKESNPEEKSNLEVEKITNVYTGVILLLQMLNQLFVLDENNQRGIKQMLVGVNALSLVTGKLLYTRLKKKVANIF